MLDKRETEVLKNVNDNDMIHSLLYLGEEVENKLAYRSANKSYYPAYTVNIDGNFIPILLTKGELEKASKRAEKNPEDILPRFEKRQSEEQMLKPIKSPPPLSITNYLENVFNKWFP